MLSLLAGVSPPRIISEAVAWAWCWAFFLKAKHWFTEVKHWGHITGRGPRKAMASPGYNEMHTSSREADVSPLFPSPDSYNERAVWDLAMVYWLH